FGCMALPVVQTRDLYGVTSFLFLSWLTRLVSFLVTLTCLMVLVWKLLVNIC
ncbi:hypothetical protein S83_071048, partial [Arachis hypogaea]